MTPFDAYNIYVALKLHFKSEDYNYTLSHGKVNTTPKSFDDRQDRTYFFVAAKDFSESEWKEHLISNLLEDSERWIGDMITDESKECNLRRMKNIQSMSYIYKQDLEAIKEFVNEDAFKSCLVARKGKHPLLVRMAMQQDISLETFVILHKSYDVIKTIEKTLDDNLVWPSFKHKVIKYSFFLNIKTSLYSNIFQEIFPVY